MAHLVLIDGHHLLYRAYWAIPRTMKTPGGQQVNTVFGVATMLLNILQKEEPDALLFCFDEGEETFRHEEYKEYKAGRAETPDDFYEQIPLAFRFIDAFGVKRASLTTHEADDVICAYAREAEKRGDRVTIVTGDRDAFQLASDKIRIAVPSKGYREPEYFGPREVASKFGVGPEQIPSYKGLVGDSSDNLPGVHGIGPKAAEQLLQKYRTLSGVYEHLSDIKPAWREKLEKDREQAFFCERMATLVCNFDLPIPVEHLWLQSISLDPVIALCKELQFSLVGRRVQTFMKTDYAAKHFIVSAEVVNADGGTNERAPSESPQLSLL